MEEENKLPGVAKPGRYDPVKLTPRELEVLGLIREGLLNQEIGEKLFIGVKTVEHHINAMNQKLGTSRSRQLLPKAFSLGIIPPLSTEPYLRGILLEMESLTARLKRIIESIK